MKCVPILVYGLEVCALDKRSLQSLDCTINRFFMKLFKTSVIKVVEDCQIFLTSSCQVHCWLKGLINLLHVVLVYMVVQFSFVCDIR